MSDAGDSGYLPPSDWRERFIALSVERNQNFRECNNCGHSGKSISDRAVMQNAWREGSMRVDEGFMLALVVCDNCGHVELFSLEALGIEEIPENPSWQTLGSRSFAKSDE